MTLSKNGQLVYELLYVVLSKKDASEKITSEQIDADIAEWARKFPGIGEEERKLIAKKLIALVGVYKPEDECIADSHEYNEQTPDWFDKIKAEVCVRFTAYLRALRAKQWSPNVVRELDKSSDVIMNYLGNPKSTSFNVRGLVMGDIQSGKTANFIALCNKAADAGYRVIIVTAGIIEKLRRQTQMRLEKEFVNLLPGKQVARLTGAAFDFCESQGKNPVSVFDKDVPVLCVVKKNVTVLRNLYEWLQTGRECRNGQDDVRLPWPLLFIDDEADNASINTNELSEEANPTKTNALIRKILKSFARSSYVGITATPFANVFIDPDTEDKVVADDLFPKSFVYRLTTPSNYFGADKLFEDGSPYLKTIDDIELWLPSSHKKADYPDEDLPESLRTAIGYYLLANGVMDVIGEEGDYIGHRSMMIHISRFIAIQNRLQSYVENYVKHIVSLVSNYCGDPQKAERKPELARLHQIWDEYDLSRACGGMSWNRFLRTVLLGAIKTIETVVVNSGAAVRTLDYEDSEKRYIVIGGNALSRGLTLEGLVVSYFRRSTMMCDTLLQMGRWCGYREGYQRLVRVWMPQGSVDHFGYASGISDELAEMFHQIVEQKGTPKDFAFKIRKSPGALLPTARNKMRTAMSIRFPIVLAGHAVETPRIQNDPAIVATNEQAVTRLVEGNWARREQTRTWDNMVFLRDVPHGEIEELLASFKAGMMSFGFMIPQIGEYIAKIGENWDVAIPVEDGDKWPRAATRKLAVVSSGREILISGTKLKVTSGGAMRYILTPSEFRSVKAEYQSKMGCEKRDPPDECYLQRAKIQGKRPLLIIQYVTMSESPKDSPLPRVTSFYALSFGFPGSKDDQITQEFFFTKRACEESALQEYVTAETEV